MNSSVSQSGGSCMENNNEFQASSTGLSFLTDFIKEKYLQEYIAEGGSKIKFVTGRPGSGKTYLLKELCRDAGELGYLTVRFSARETWLHDFREIYLEILDQVDIMSCLQKCADQIVREMGYVPQDIPEGQTFLDMLSGQGLGDALTKREIRLQLKEMFLQDPLMDNNFALSCSLLTGNLLGHPLLELQNQELLLGWLHGDKTVKLSLLRSLGLSPARITKYNARHMLRSLSEVIRKGGYKGLLICIDDLDILQSRSGMEGIHYTKLRREDTYESIRQLIDDIDSLRHIMFVFAFDRILLDNDNAGFQSYQALWMRIQNEVRGERFNRFADIVDLDLLAYQTYTPEYLVSISNQMLDMQREALPKNSPITLTEAETLLRESRLGGVGLPQLVAEYTTAGASDARPEGGANHV